MSLTWPAGYRCHPVNHKRVVDVKDYWVVHGLWLNEIESLRGVIRQNTLVNNECADAADYKTPVKYFKDLEEKMPSLIEGLLT